jgi:hypothetical protein
MEPLADSRVFPAYVESAEAGESPSETGESGRLAALLMVLTPFALAAWLAIGLAVYLAVT